MGILVCEQNGVRIQKWGDSGHHFPEPDTHATMKHLWRVFLVHAAASASNCTVTTEQGVVEGSWFSQYPSCEYKASTTLVIFITTQRSLNQCAFNA